LTRNSKSNNIHLLSFASSTPQRKENIVKEKKKPRRGKKNIDKIIGPCQPQYNPNPLDKPDSKRQKP
jgi:hypothetical protein